MTIWRTTALYYLNLIFYLIFLNSCAAVKAPSGGPKDKTPPVLIGSDPPQGTTGWSGNKIRLFFFRVYERNWT